MRLIYASRKGGKPLRMGMNQAKRVAHASDRRDQLIVQRELGTGLPRQHHHHQQLVRQRHQYYADIGAEAERERASQSDKGPPGEAAKEPAVAGDISGESS